MASWRATEAKAKFSAVLDKAEAEGPQLVRRRKQDFFVLTREQMEECSAPGDPHERLQNLSEFFKASPLRGSGLRVTRSKAPARQVML